MDKNLEGLSLEDMNGLFSGKNPTLTTATPGVVPPATEPVTPPATEPAPAPTPDPVTPPVTATPPVVTPPVVTPAPGAPPVTLPPIVPPVVPEPPATPIAVDYAALTGGIAKTEDEFKAFLQTSNILKQQFTELQSQTAFRSDGSKQLFDLVNRIEGQPITAVLNYLRVKELDVEKLPGQQQRLEAFLLKPEVIATGMSQDDLRAAFLEQDVESFGDPSNEAIPRTSTQILNEKLATQAAKAALLKAKEDLKDFGKQAQGATVKTPEQLAAEQIEFRNLAQANIIGYNSMTMEVKTTNAEGKQVTGVAKVNFTPDQHERLLSLVSDPVAWWDKQILGSGAMNDKGEINWNKFADLGSRLEFQAEREEALYRQGREDAIAEFVSQHRNPPAPATSGSSAPPTVPVKAKSDMEIMAEGILGRVGK